MSGIFNVGTGKARSFRDLISAHVPRARPRAEHRIHRHAATASAASTSISRKPRSRTSAAPATTPASRRWRMRSGSYVTQVPRHRRPLPLRPADVRFRKTALRARQADGALHRRPDARLFRLWRRVAHLAGGAGAGHRGAPRGRDRRRRRQRRAQHREPRRALHLRRRRRQGHRTARSSSPSWRAQERRSPRTWWSIRRGRPRASCASCPSITRPICCAPTGKWRKPVDAEDRGRADQARARRAAARPTRW